MTATVIKLSIQRMVCTACGAEANASCNCGVAYQPKAVRAAEAVKANPEKSDRAIAKDIGASPTTVGKAREELSSGGQLEEAPRVGIDGKVRKARKMPEKKEEPEEEEDTEYTGDKLIAWLRDQNKILRRHAERLEKKLLEAPLKEKGRYPNFNDWRKEFERANKLEARVNELLEALSAKEKHADREWPDSMTPKQLKRREKILGNIAWWQRDLECLYGEATGTPSWRVEIFYEDGTRLSNGLRFGTRDEAESYRVATYKKEIVERKEKGHCEVLPSADKPSVDTHGNSILFAHGDCVLFNWDPVTP